MVELLTRPNRLFITECHLADNLMITSKIAVNWGGGGIWAKLGEGVWDFDFRPKH
jgi:hypothetical protein